MDWKKPSEKLIKLLQQAADSRSEVEKRKMFGCPCYFVGGNMAFGVFADTLFFRLDEKDRKTLSRNIGKPFEPQPGRTMKEYLQIPGENTIDGKLLNELITKSVLYTAGIPPKKKKS